MIIRRLQNLANFNFIHILSEPRSGSSQLFDQLRIHKQPNTVHMYEPIRVLKLDPYELCNELEQNSNKYFVMKNHLQDIINLPTDLQKRYFNLPGKKIGLSRRNLFEQACSLLLANESNNWLGNSSLDQQYSFTFDQFDQALVDLVQEKTQMSNHIQIFDKILFYEDIVWPNISTQHLPHKNLPKHHHIANLDQLKNWYQQWIHHNQLLIDQLAFALETTL